MARYYEETALIEFVKKYTPTINGETTMECVERAIREAPTADVVPKSEVDAVVSAVDNSTNEFLKLHDKYQEAEREIEKLELTLQGVMWSVDKWLDEKDYDSDPIKRAITMREKTLKIVENAKADVAREIFEEIERGITKFGILPNNCVIVSLDTIAELKKKYTEGE